MLYRKFPGHGVKQSRDSFSMTDQLVTWLCNPCLPHLSEASEKLAVEQQT
jgi:hypothetical protein